MRAQFDTIWFDQGAWLFRRGEEDEAAWVPSTRWSPGGDAIVADVLRGHLVERLHDLCRHAGDAHQSRLVSFSSLPRRGTGKPTDQIRRWERSVRDGQAAAGPPELDAEGSRYRLGVDLRAQVEFAWTDEQFAFKGSRRAAGTVTLHRAALGPPLHDPDYDLLASNRLFGETADPRLVWLVWAASRHGPRTIPAGHPVIEEGTTDPALRLVLSGAVDVVDAGDVVATIPQASLCGELEVLGAQSTHRFRNVARVDTRILEIGKEEVGQIAAVFPELWRGLGFVTVLKLRDLTSRSHRPSASTAA